MAGAVTRQEVDETFGCQESGQLSFEGEFDFDDPDFAFDVTLSLQACDGIDGTLTFAGGGTITEDRFDFDLTLDGTVANACTITFDQFREAVFVNLDTEELAVTLDGAISATCGSESFTCTLNDVALTEESEDEEVFADRCRLN